MSFRGFFGTHVGSGFNSNAFSRGGRLPSSIVGGGFVPSANDGARQPVPQKALAPAEKSELEKKVADLTQDLNDSIKQLQERDQRANAREQVWLDDMAAYEKEWNDFTEKERATYQKELDLLKDQKTQEEQQNAKLTSDYGTLLDRLNEEEGEHQKEVEELRRQLYFADAALTISKSVSGAERKTKDLTHIPAADVIETATQIFNAGVDFEEGDNGFPENQEMAAICYKLAAQLGHVDAMYNLAICYLNGDGIPKDRGEAVRRLKTLRDTYNDKDARDKLAALGEDEDDVSDEWSDDDNQAPAHGSPEGGTPASATTGGGEPAPKAGSKIPASDITIEFYKLYQRQFSEALKTLKNRIRKNPNLQIVIASDTPAAGTSIGAGEAVDAWQRFNRFSEQTLKIKDMGHLGKSILLLMRQLLSDFQTENSTNVTYGLVAKPDDKNENGPVYVWGANWGNFNKEPGQKFTGTGQAKFIGLRGAKNEVGIVSMPPSKKACEKITNSERLKEWIEERQKRITELSERPL